MGVSVSAGEIQKAQSNAITRVQVKDRTDVAVLSEKVRSMNQRLEVLENRMSKSTKEGQTGDGTVGKLDSSRETGIKKGVDRGVWQLMWRSV